MIEYQWLAVRDAQNPRKVFGFIKLPSNIRNFRLPIRRSMSVKDFDADASPRPISSVDFIDLKFEIMGEGPTRERCIVSEDRSISFWRTVSGFLEAQITEAPAPQRVVKKPSRRKLPKLEVEL